MEFSSPIFSTVARSSRKSSTSSFYEKPQCDTSFVLKATFYSEADNLTPWAMGTSKDHNSLKPLKSSKNYDQNVTIKAIQKGNIQYMLGK